VVSDGLNYPGAFTATCVHERHITGCRRASMANSELNCVTAF